MAKNRTTSRKPVAKDKPAKAAGPEQPQPLDPEAIYRFPEVVRRRLFGYRPTQLYEKIKDGLIPPPFPLSDDGRAVGWFGKTIIKYHEERQAAAELKAAELATARKSRDQAHEEARSRHR